MIEMSRCCEVCHNRYTKSELIAVDGIDYLKWERDYPWYICKACAEKISDALLVKVVQDCIDKREDGNLLTNGQKHYIKLFVDNNCTDGYLMTKLGIFEWKDAMRLVEQYKKEEGKNE